MGGGGGLYRRGSPNIMPTMSRVADINSVSLQLRQWVKIGFDVVNGITRKSFVV